MGRHTFVSLPPSDGASLLSVFPDTFPTLRPAPQLRNPAHLQESNNQFFQNILHMLMRTPEWDQALEEERTVVYPTKFSFASRMCANNPAKVVENHLASGLCKQHAKTHRSVTQPGCQQDLGELRCLLPGFALPAQKVSLFPCF